MVVGGYPSAAYGDVDLVDLTDATPNCPAIPDFATDYGAVGTFINDRAMVCGGFGPGYPSTCQTFNNEV